MQQMQHSHGKMGHHGLAPDIMGSSELSSQRVRDSVWNRSAEGW
jgi:hypothetical protein